MKNKKAYLCIYLLALLFTSCIKSETKSKVDNMLVPDNFIMIDEVKFHRANA